MVRREGAQPLASRFLSRPQGFPRGPLCRCHSPSLVRTQRNSPRSPPVKRYAAQMRVLQAFAVFQMLARSNQGARFFDLSHGDDGGADFP